MPYQDTLNWMFSQLPMYQKQGKKAYKADLSNTLKLIKYLNFPEQNFKSIHVAGTNGKGSTSHMLASILQEAGYKVGLYTSPHLKDFRERIKVNGQVISKQFVIEFIKHHKTFFQDNQLSFFEMTVGMAFDYFSEQNIDIAVVEVGLGGRLDSTNVITPEVSVITNIGIDHIQFLGDTLEAIAFEKGGIIKPNIPVVIGETQEETTTVFEDLAKVNNSEIVFADIQEKGYNISNKNIKQGLLSVASNTDLLGRWQVLQNNPKVVCDTGHNREGLIYVMQQLSKEVFKTLHIVFGVVNDKDISSIIDLLPKNTTYYLCKPNISRGLDAKELMRVFNEYGLKGVAYNSVNQAYNQALKNASEEDFIFIGGSTFVVAEVV